MHTKTTTTARGLGRLAALLTTLLAALLPLTGTGPASASPTAPPPAQATPLTELTIKTPGCTGCEIRLFQAIDGRQRVWQSRAKTTTDGRVTFTVPTNRTHGLTMSVHAPWEASSGIPTGYVTLTAFRYRGHTPGSAVDLETARAQKYASACWAGTSRRATTLRVAVRKVRVMGTTGTTDGTIAWLPVQARTWAPMRHVVRGVFGTQEVQFCKGP